MACAGQDVMERLHRRTYVLRHSPNCAKPFEVRLTGRRAGMLDLRLDGTTQDVLGYGFTMEEAAQNALDEHAKNG